MSRILLVFAATTWAAASGQEPSLELDKREGAIPRNVIFILIDDLRHDTFSFCGHPFVKTPQIDRLAENGVHFANAFVTTSLCSPSRASILTGKYMHAHGVFDNNNPAPPGTVYFPQHLQKAGYQTAFIGKWHMGGGGDAPQPGFDRWVSFRGQGHYLPPPGGRWSLNVDGESVPQKGYITDELTDYAVDWLDKRDPDRPFFLYLSHKATHAGFVPAERHRGAYKDASIELPSAVHLPLEGDGVPMWVKNQRNSWHGVEFPYHSKLDLENFYREYCETILAVDDCVGRILDWLERNGLFEETVVLFMGDNGFLWGEHGLIDKRCAYEESIRVPLLAHCPALTKGARKVDAIAANIDVAPTVLELAGLTPPADMHGVSLAAFLSPSESPAKGREHLYYEYFWEWNFPQTPTMFALRSDRYKFIEYHGVWDTDELFDLQEDPGETTNLIQDPMHRTIAAQMRARLHAMRKESGVRAPIGAKQGRGAALRKADGSPAAQFPSDILRP